MGRKTFRVHYDFDGKRHEIDFFIGSDDMRIVNQMKNRIAWRQITKAHPDIQREDVSNIIIDDLPE